MSWEKTMVTQNTETICMMVVTHNQDGSEESNPHFNKPVGKECLINKWVMTEHRRQGQTIFVWDTKHKLHSEWNIAQ